MPFKGGTAMSSHIAVLVHAGALDVRNADIYGHKKRRLRSQARLSELIIQDEPTILTYGESTGDVHYASMAGTFV